MNYESYKNRLLEAFSKLGELLYSLGSGLSWPGYEIGLNEDEYLSFQENIIRAKVKNQWFSESNTKQAFLALSTMLKKEELINWLDQYSIKSRDTKTVAIIMAGNLPLVGFHDLMCVLFSGNKALIKLSSDDDVLLPPIVNFLNVLEPELKDMVSFVEGRMEGFDKVIATGSNNTSRYFESYFGKYPNIIRKNRSSVAILEGDESKEELEALGNDIFSYFGLGCRNVSKLYLPEGYDLDVFFKSIYSFGDIINHNKYANNYDYNKAVWLLNEDKILDNGFIILKESNEISAPTASLYYEYYSDSIQLERKLKEIEDQIQCVVSKNHISFGEAQNPSLNDYADRVDTMSFLISD